MTVAVLWGVPRAELSREGDELPADEELVRAAEAALAHGGRTGLELELVLVDDPTLCELHGRFLGDPTPTDVIAFDLGEGPGPEGELYVSVERARAVAERRGVALAREVALYVVHGVLHLCGHDDHDDESRRAMRAAERAVLAGLGYAPDDAPHEEPSERA